MEDKGWFLYVVDHHEGPFSRDEIKELVKKGEAKASSYVWKEGFEDWTMMSELADFGEVEGRGVPSFVINASESVWCLNSKKTFSGPYSIKTIVRKINDGEASIKDSVWKEGWTSFARIESIPDFMKSVKPAAIEISKSIAVRPGAGARALGMAGGPSTRVYKWYKSTKFLLIAFFVCFILIYQGLVTGALDPILEPLKIKETVVSLRLAPLPVDKGADLVLAIRDNARPSFEKMLLMTPSGIRNWLSSIEVPEGLSAVDAETLRSVAVASLKDGVRVATALPAGDEFNPSFVLMSNAPDSASFVVVLRGKEGTLLNAFAYERTALVEINKSVGRTPRFLHEGNKPLPRGEYSLSVYEAGQPVSAEVPQGKSAITVDSYFLGGKRDMTYQTRLKEFNERVKVRLEQESADLTQLVATIESMANESASKFFAAAKASSQQNRKSEWAVYHQKYARLSAQVRSQIDKSLNDQHFPDYVLPQLYRKTLATYELTEQLHGLQTAFIEKGETMDTVQALASQTVASLSELKQAIAKVAK